MDDNETSRPSAPVQDTPNQEGVLSADTKTAAGDELTTAQACEALKAAAVERKALLREIDHRVKNNMQLVISFLNIGAQQVQDVEMHPVFLACQDRMGALSLVHETLYKSSRLQKVDLVFYLEQLVASLARHYNRGQVNIRTAVKAIPLELDTDRLIDIGLVLSELLSNACKHAFPVQPDGTIRVEMMRLEDNVVELIVADDGVGMRAVDATKKNAFGLKFAGDIIKRNFSGDMQIQHGEGTSIVIRFPASL